MVIFRGLGHDFTYFWCVCKVKDLGFRDVSGLGFRV